MHGEDGTMVALKVDEPVSGWLARELVGHDLDGDDPFLPQGHHGVGQELLVHVRLEAADPERANAGHLGVSSVLCQSSETETKMEVCVLCFVVFFEEVGGMRALWDGGRGHGGGCGDDVDVGDSVGV